MTRAWKCGILLSQAALVLTLLVPSVPSQQPEAQPPSPQPPSPQPPSPQPPSPQPPSPQPPSPATAEVGDFGSIRALLSEAQAVGAPPSASRVQAAQAAAGTPGGELVSGGASASAYNAPDVGRLLTKSDESTGIQNQFRNAITADPRIRGYHVGQITTYGDGGYFVPARLDLDTIVSKFDPTAVRDVIVIKGPYSVRYGPGFAFLDIATFDSPRSQPCTFEFHERTIFSYNTNGQGLHGLQTFEFGAPDWGVRATYDIRVSNDYKAGEGVDVPSSYNSQNGVFAVGFSFNDYTKIEFKAVRLYQHDVEFPGLFFDLNRQDTEAYSLRFAMNDPDSMHKVYADLWYNFTGANGDTHQGAKQAFVNDLINRAFMVSTSPPSLRDFSNTNFSEQSRGYRLTWGQGDKGTPQLGVGTDLNIVSQRLEEHIRLLPQNGFDTTGIGTPDPFLRQDLGIPVSREVDAGVFVDGSLPVGERLEFRAGMRADWIRASSDARMVTGNIITVPGTVNPAAMTTTPDQTTLDLLQFSVIPEDANLVRHFTLWSGFITGEYKIDDHLSAQIGFAHAQRPPTLTELYAAGPFVAVLQQGLNRLIGDPHLRPETANQIDLGFKGRYEHLRFGVNGFYSWVQDYITFDQNKAQSSQISQVVYTNTDLARLAGGEIYLEADAGDWLTPFGTVSYVQGRDLSHIDARRSPDLVSSRRTLDTEPLPGIPPLELRGGLRLHEPTKRPRWAVEFSARSVMGQHEVASTLNEFPSSGFTIFDLRGYWQATPNFLLISGVENLGDKFYREHLDPRSGIGEPPVPVLFRPGANFYITAQVRY